MEGAHLPYRRDGLASLDPASPYLEEERWGRSQQEGVCPAEEEEGIESEEERRAPTLEHEGGLKLRKGQQAD